MILKPPLTIEQQIHQLERHGMHIPDRDKAQRFLSTVNYYRFSGYALEYRRSVHSSDYMPSANFDTIVKIYDFDKALRHILRNYLEKAEVYYKTQIAYTFSLLKCQESPHNQHYLPGNYYKADRFRDFLKHLSTEERYFQDTAFVKHHMETYNNQMPLWVLVEIMTFATLSKLYNCMYISDQERIASNVGTSARILKNNLHAMTILRNKCAHGARLYNDTMALPVAFSPNFLRRYKSLEANSIFAYIVMLHKRLPDGMSRAMLQNDILHLVAEYEDSINLELMGFPSNWQLLL